MAFGWRPDVVDPFGGIRDDPDAPDNYGFDNGENTGRVFISYERHSVKLAEGFEASLRARGLVPWRYEPLPRESPSFVAISETSRLAQVEAFQKHSPDLARRLEATVSRSDACIFLVSDRTFQSALCEMEAMSAFIVHGHAGVAQAPVYVVLLGMGIQPPVFLQSFRSIDYTTGLEETLAERIADNVGIHRIRKRLIKA